MVFIGEADCFNVEQRGQIHFSDTASCVCVFSMSGPELSEKLFLAVRE